MDIGKRVRAARKRAQLSQDGLAREAKMSVSAVAQIEQGGRTDPHYSTLEKLAEALNMSVGELLEEPALTGKDEATPPGPLPLDIDRLKEVAIKEARPSSFSELQTAVEDRIEQRYSDEELFEFKDELEEIRKALSPVKATRFDTYAKVVETENYVRRVLEKIAGRVK